MIVSTDPVIPFCDPAVTTIQTLKKLVLSFRSTPPQLDAFQLKNDLKNF